MDGRGERAEEASHVAEDALNVAAMEPEAIRAVAERADVLGGLYEARSLIGDKVRRYGMKEAMGLSDMLMHGVLDGLEEAVATIHEEMGRLGINARPACMRRQDAGTSAGHSRQAPQRGDALSEDRLRGSGGERLARLAGAGKRKKEGEEEGGRHRWRAVPPLQCAGVACGACACRRRGRGGGWMRDGGSPEEKAGGIHLAT